jgi:hypothetical protein
MKNAYKILVKTERKRQLGIYRPRWDDNIKTNLKGIKSEGGIRLAQNRVQRQAIMNMVKNLQVP